MKNFRLLLLSMIVLIFIYGLVAAQPEHAAGSVYMPPAQVEGTAAVFLPMISKEGNQPPAGNEPVLPDRYPSEQDEAPELPDAPQTSACQSFIRFSNYTNYPIYVYWNRLDGTDVFYKLLDAGRQYWQHTYLGNQWNVRDDQGRLIKNITAARCDNTFIDIYIGDLPACGRITNVVLWDLINDRAVPGYEAIVNGTVIPLTQLTNVNLRVTTQEVIESIKFDLNGATLISNVSPYSYPGALQPWQPDAGVYTLVVEAYRQNDAKSALCDQRRLTLQIGDSSTPVASLTPTPSATPTITATVVVSATPTATPSPTATTGVTLTPTPTVVSTVTVTTTPTPTLTPSACSGRIADFRLFNLTNGQVIAAYNPLLDGAVIDLATLPDKFNLEVGVSGVMDSVTFQVNDTETVENFAPYRYPAGDIVPWRPAPGFYTIRVVAYSQDNASGLVCDIKLLYLTFVNSGPTATPTLTPTATPTITPTPMLAANCIGDRVWRDADGDGIQDDGETGLVGVPVYIGRDDDNNGRLDRILATTTSASTGRYAFCSLPPATYLVEFGAAQGCINTLVNQGADDTIDSDASVGYGVSPPVVLIAGGADSTIDAGFICN